MSSGLESGRFFLPGPTEVHPDVRAAQAGPMIGHRGPEIQALMASLLDGLKPVFQTDRNVIISTSSATGLMEAAVRNGTTGGKVLSLVNGAFSQRFSSISKACGYETDVWEVEYGQVHDPNQLEERLKAGDYQAVTLSHSETSTGALQPLEEIAKVLSGFPDAFLLVDSVTGIGGVETHPDDWGVEFILTGSQKAMALPPGLGFGLASNSMVERSAKAGDKGWYFDIARLMDSLERNETPATPAVSLLYALDLQLKRIADETMEARWARHLTMQRTTLDWVESMKSQGAGIDALAGDGHRSPTVTCLKTGEAARVVSDMRDRGWIIGAGYGKLKESTIRIGHMGDHSVDEVEALLDELSQVV